MKTIAFKADVDTAPKWLRDFIREAWNPEDGTPFCTLDPDLAAKVAAQIERGIREHQLRYFQFQIDQNGGRFEHVDIWTPGGLLHQMAVSFVDAWSNRQTLSTCKNCGNYILPGKGRTAAFCSAKCRVAAHRAGVV